MLTQITDLHHQRLACVYIRQSTVEQVRSHRESTLRQHGLAERAEQLGWPRPQILVIDEDLGKSAATTTDERPGYRKMLALVAAGQVGIILVVEVSRLAREDLSWQVMFRHCQFMNVLLADEEHIYNPLDPHERMMLGLLATFAGFELTVLRQRMQQAWQQKAARGELFCACPPGYIVADDHRLVKTPDRRVQHTIALIFAQFSLQPSVGALCRWCCQQGVQMPVCRDAGGRTIEWKEPTSAALIRWLRNPTYAGAYVIGRKKTSEILLPDGQTRKQTIKLPLEQWPLVIHDHHEPYLSWEQFTGNYRRLQKPTPHPDSAHRPVGRGDALLAGVLRCRRCGYGLHVRYDGHGAVRYHCLAGGKQRDGQTKSCFSFSGNDLDALIGAQLLEVVRPAGVEAALRAAEELTVSGARQRQVLADQLEHDRYEAARARRQYDQVDPENRLVCAELERRWNDRLAAAADSDQRLAEFDRDRPGLPAPATQEALLDLGRHLETVWFAASASITTKKQIVRLLIEHIIVDLDTDNQLHIIVHWIGGHHSEHLQTRTTRPSRAQTLNLVETVKSLRVIADDAHLARMLNRAALHSPRGATWTAERIAAFRHRHQIPAYDADEKNRRGLLLQEEVAVKLDISPMSVHRLLSAGILPGDQIQPGLPWLIPTSALEENAVKTAVTAIKQSAAAAPNDNPNQPPLW